MAYKATYNFKCKNQEYKVGKTYTSDKMKMCKHGIHFCQDMKDVLYYYNFNENFILLEIEVLGNVETDNDKSVTDKIKVLRVVPFEEYTFKNNLPVLEYDKKGNKISETYRSGYKTTWEYDDNGNKISETYPSGDKYTWEYDDNGNKISETHPSKEKFTWEYDEKGNKISLTSRSGYKTTYEYDERGNMISQISQSGYKITYEYDEKRNRISKTYPDEDKITYEYAQITELDD